ncbi:MAG TPA: carbon-nitrogen hydrolase family protein [Bryobacteraceae bacterium]|nr:carbon-nitrogen hydrolase family protein [Bryobacteraceae bacterium]
MVQRALLFFALSATVSLCAEPNLIRDPDFRAVADKGAQSWKTWAPRPEIAAKGEVIASAGGNLLAMRGENFGSYGKWITTVRNINPGQHYSFEILRKASGVQKEEVSVGVILSWCKDEEGATPIQRDYVDRIAEAGEWRREFRVLQAPQAARSVTVELFLRWTAGSVLWKSPRLLPVAAPKPRVVRVATTHLIPGPPNTLESNMSAIRGMIERAAAEKPDVVLLSETVVDRLLDMPLTKRAQPIPGPLTAMLSELARRHRAYIVTTLEEVDAGLVYNTAVLIDRQGRIAGKYRKVHLPTMEAEDGVTPGSDYPVFDTDFGRVGILTCWDNWFIEPARILRLKGAEILFFPIMGDEPAHWDLMSRARAVDNGVFIVSSNTVGNTASRIIDPSGEVLAEASGPAGLAVKDLDLDKQWRTMWLSVGPSYGEGKSLYIKERRPDTYGVFTGDAHSRSR